MIRFDISKLKVQHVKIKSVSGVLGGTVSILDEKRSTPTHEVFTKIRVPVSVARAFHKRYEIKTYMKPVLGALVFYDNRIVALERHPLGNLGKEETEGLFGKVKWKAQCEHNIDDKMPYLVETGDWYIDGTYVYSFPPGAIDGASRLSQDGSFRQVQATAIKLADLTQADLEYTDRVCLAYYTQDGEYTISPPIWKTLDRIGSKEMERANEDESVTYLATDLHRFDEIDDTLCVNLSFVLKAGRELANVFGYDSIQPLNLPQLMLQMKTVNLPNVPASVKNTYDTGLPFSHAAAWLIGLLRQVETLESYMVVRSLLKYLTSRGVYRKGAFTQKAVLRDGVNFDGIPLKTLEEAALASLPRVHNTVDL